MAIFGLFLCSHWEQFFSVLSRSFLPFFFCCCFLCLFFLLIYLNALNSLPNQDFSYRQDTGCMPSRVKCHEHWKLLCATDCEWKKSNTDVSKNCGFLLFSVTISITVAGRIITTVAIHRGRASERTNALKKAKNVSILLVHCSQDFSCAALNGNNCCGIQRVYISCQIYVWQRIQARRAFII